MREHRVLRLRGSDLEIELHPSAFTAQTVASQDSGIEFPDPDQCECTHSIQTEHNETGCLQGCPAETCARTGAVEAMA